MEEKQHSSSEKDALEWKVREQNKTLRFYFSMFRGAMKPPEKRPRTEEQAPKAGNCYLLYTLHV